MTKEFEKLLKEKRVFHETMERILDVSIKGSFTVNEDKTTAYKNAIEACSLLSDKGKCSFVAASVEDALEFHDIRIEWKESITEFEADEIKLLVYIIMESDFVAIEPDSWVIIFQITTEN